MQVSGFTFIKNGLTLGYPIAESIESIAPLCDEVIINVGFNNQECTDDDGTEEYLRSKFTDKKFKFLKSWWDPSLQSQGLILSQQTNIALEQCQGKYCQYIQGDEVIHESDLSIIEAGIKDMDENPKINGLIFRYLHFFGNVDIYLHTRKVYRREVRTIRNRVGLQSHLDAQGFRFADGSKMLAKQIEARIFHYGWARAEQVMAKKVVAFDKLYHGNERDLQPEFKYQRLWGLRKFTDTHPQVVKNWIEQNKNEVDLLKLKYEFDIKDIRLMIGDAFEAMTGLRLGEFKNFKEI